MLSKKALLVLALPLTFSSVYARNTVMPKEDGVLSSFLANESLFVLKDAKGTISSSASFLTKSPANWFNLSPSDGAEGVRTEEAYNTFGMPASEDVIVAVVDSGVDVNHEDLQGKIWTNEGEIPNNGIDDDQNGYVDDVFGWNFIGGAAGMAKIENDSSLENGIRLIKGNPAEQVGADTLEITREYVRMKKLRAEGTLSAEQAAYFDALEKEFTEKVTSTSNVVATYTDRLEKYKKLEATLNAAGVATMTIEAVRALESSNPVIIIAKRDMLAMLTNNLTEARLNQVITAYSERLHFHYNEHFNPREIVKDNYADSSERVYGNSDVIGPDSGHGTHVAGIIAANRANDIGMKGVAANVKIMAVRVVPNGDERDKDVANGIRYAVDNGAKIINMSFGKAFSPQKGVVDEAMKYAASKGVLLLHAAGNDSKDNDLKPSYPTRTTAKTGEEISTWLEIGASAYLKGTSLPASFTNYGKKTVDIFAPGVEIFSTIPDNGYGLKSGTSMATPVAAGVAALVMSHEPNMTSLEVKALMLKTGREYPGLMVIVPGTEKLVDFNELSSKGSITDVVSALQGINR